MKKTVLLSFLLICSLGISAQQVAYIYSDSILMAAPGYIEKQQELTTVHEKYVQELEMLQKELSEKFAQLVASYNAKENETIDDLKARMSPADVMRLDILLEEQTAIETKTKSYDNMLNFMYEQDVQPIETRVQQTINAYAVKNKIDMIYIIEKIQESLAYINEKRNITNEIIKLLQ